VSVDRDTFAELARRLARGFSRLDRDMICCGDVTLQQFETLRELHAAGTLLTGAIAERLGIDLSTASRNLAVLARAGYVARVSVKDDRRAVGHHLTKKGERCVTSLRCDERDVFESVLARIPKREHATVLEALSVLAEAVEQKGPDGSNDAKSCVACVPNGDRAQARLSKDSEVG
jgi:putative acetyltransferase